MTPSPSSNWLALRSKIAPPSSKRRTSREHWSSSKLSTRSSRSPSPSTADFPRNDAQSSSVVAVPTLKPKVAECIRNLKLSERNSVDVLRRMVIGADASAHKEGDSSKPQGCAKLLQKLPLRYAGLENMSRSIARWLAWELKERSRRSHESARWTTMGEYYSTPSCDQRSESRIGERQSVAFARRTWSMVSGPKKKKKPSATVYPSDSPLVRLSLSAVSLCGHIILLACATPTH